MRMIAMEPPLVRLSVRWFDCLSVELAALRRATSLLCACPALRCGSWRQVLAIGHPWSSAHMVGTDLGQLDRDRAPDALARPGHDGHAAIECIGGKSHGSCSLLVLGWVRRPAPTDYTASGV